MRLVAVTQAAQDLHGVVDRRLLDADLLEAALQRCIALEVLAVLVERRRADRLQLAARPSTTAVLPTPGSPISTGLFFVRRDRICITRSISVWRPTTGSSLPSEACFVRLRPNWSRSFELFDFSPAGPPWPCWRRP